MTTLNEAAETVAGFLDVDSVRYPSLVAVAHVNEAIHTLVREYEIPVTRRASRVNFTPPAVITEDPWLTYPGSFALADYLGDDDFDYDYAIGVWNTPFKEANRVLPVEAEEMFDEYGDDEGTTPLVYSIYAGRFFVRPMPPAGTTFNLRVLWAGKPKIKDGALTSPIIDYVPWGVIYRACEVASGWLLEESRVPVFTAARTQQMESATVTASMEHDSVSYEMKEP